MCAGTVTRGTRTWYHVPGTGRAFRGRVWIRLIYRGLTRSFRLPRDHVNVKRRRFAVLATILVAVNVYFWLAATGFALPTGGIVQTLFGGKMIRAEVVWQAPDGSIQDTQLYRGVITAVSPTSITLHERDRTDTLTLASTVNVRYGSIAESVAALRRGMRVLVVEPANAPVDTIQIEALGP
jgi:hypothetical protein